VTRYSLLAGFARLSALERILRLWPCKNTLCFGTFVSFVASPAEWRHGFFLGFYGFWVEDLYVFSGGGWDGVVVAGVPPGGWGGVEECERLAGPSLTVRVCVLGSLGFGCLLVLARVGCFGGI